MTTYTINAADTETTPTWMALCATATPGPQDSGRCRWTVTTEHEDALEAALEADADVLSYDVTDEPRAPQWRIVASMERDGQVLDATDMATLGDDLVARWASREEAEARAAELQAEIGDCDLDPSTSYSVVEAE